MTLAQNIARILLDEFGSEFDVSVTPQAGDSLTRIVSMRIGDSEGRFSFHLLNPDHGYGYNVEQARGTARKMLSTEEEGSAA